ncbi:hypothetical protein EZL74_07990 [Flavobacterium silvisoli]|uniref:Type II CBASS E2 protein domain-containing protein n=2 Tax=Flavobacterium silvisoli TaxID=2529433 RepID=A0A4Q9YYP2_9FLAO|nr:hypothetical protein EZL74_07990 [Flavobacterium silvisoli]
MGSSFIKGKRSITRKGFSAKTQLEKILEFFPTVNILRSGGNFFEIEMKVKPSFLGKDYDIKLTFDRQKGVQVYVINEVLRVARNRSKLPHVYSHNEQRLCLYSPSKGEWTKEKLIASTIIPWISKWLFFYEIWLIDGEWLGGGHDEYSLK